VRQPKASLTNNPVAAISARAAARLRGGHVWVYRSDLVTDAGAAPGAVVDVSDERGRLLGTALYSSASAIALRLVSRRPTAEAEVVDQLIPERIRAAIDYRRQIVRDSDAYRLAFSEGDSLPGLIIDLYRDILSVQIVTQTFDRADVRQRVLEEITSREIGEEPLETVVERVDDRIRELEQLPRVEPRVLWQREPEGAARTSTEFIMNEVRFHYDALTGQKTGAFLDQRENYAAVESYAHGEALDCFCYQGGFSLHLARACSRVTGVDSSRPALEIAEQNATLNQREVEWIEGNAFDLLKDYAAAGKRCDTIVLDPPAFAKSRASVPTALRGYKELNLRALKMLRPNGILATYSCSFHVSQSDFMAMLASAAADAGRTVRVLEARGAAQDHPAVLTIPETAYLKCVICRVSQ
jgi:23S rRNA (cytosine1962-C5)-methyltransferase